MFSWLKLCLCPISSKEENEKILTSKKNEKIPVNDVGILSYLFVSWMTPLVWWIYKNRDQPIKEDDIWKCSDLESAAYNTERLSKEWTREVRDEGVEKASLMRVWFRCIRVQLVLLTVVACVEAVVSFLISSYLMELIVSFLHSTKTSRSYGWSLVVAMCIGEITQASTTTFLFMYGNQIGVRFRAGIIGMVYQKLLKTRTMKANEIAEVVTIIGADSLRIVLNSYTFVYLVVTPVYLIIGGVFLYHLIGVWCLIGTGVFVVFYQIQMYLMTVLSSLRKQCLYYTDMRIRKMAEMITSMKFIKMYAWEKPFEENLKRLRKSERWYLLQATIFNSLSGSVKSIGPAVACIVTIASVLGSGHKLESSWVFSLVVTMSFMRKLISLTTLASRTFGDTRVSFDRIKALLTKEEFLPPLSECVKNENAVEINGNLITASTGDKNQRPMPQMNISLCVKKGILLGVCGPVGCGKSSLITAILGRMPGVSAHVAVSGSVAYAAQQAWIHNGTVRENITFGKPFEPAWYEKVISVCGLGPDLAIFDHGDVTEIGERGFNLSGGQKLRIGLARAVYSRSDIYLLDDPLSAVDIHVGQHLFHKCIRNTLKNKTVILLTHQIQFLQHCDEILVLEGGNIVQHGNPGTLMLSDGYYSDAMNKLSESYSCLPTQEYTECTEKTKSDGQGFGITTNVFGLQSKKLPANRKVTKESRVDKISLIKKEKIASGNIRWKTYKSYISAGGGTIVAILVLLSYTAAQGSVVFSTTWLGIWISSVESNITTTRHQLTRRPSNNSVLMNCDAGEEVWNVYFIVYCATIAGIIIFSTFRVLISSIATVNASATLNNRALDKVMKAPMRFFDSNPCGRILNRFSRDLDEGDVYIPMCLEEFLVKLNYIGISIGVASYSTPWILMAVVPLTVFLYVLNSISFPSIRELKRFENVTRSPLLSHVHASVEGLSTITSLKQQDRFIEKCWKLIDTTSYGLLTFYGSSAWISVRLDLLASLITIVCSLVVIVTKGTVDPSFAAMSLTLCVSTVPTIQTLFRTMNETEARFTSIERIQEYEQSLNVEKDVNPFELDENWPVEGHIFFSDVQLTYHSGLHPVLKNVRFEIHPREKIGIVGRTGAGKSSIVSAFFRLVELSKGHIYIDGVDISQVPLHVLRSRLSMIPQDPVLFSGTIRENLDPFKTMGDEEIWLALDNAHIKDKIHSLKGMLDYTVEENGGNFSVGERQLLCLARAILRRNKILILDEATASIDAATDAIIQQTIRNSFPECTVLTIAHRINTILHCDKVFVIDAGEIVKIGNPQDLIQNQSAFSNCMGLK